MHKRKRSEAGPSGGTEERPETKKLTTACTQCRKQKIKCEMLNEEPPCTRCQRRGFNCVLHTAVQNHRVDQKQMGLLTQDMGNVFSVLGRICQQLDIEPPALQLSAKDNTDSEHAVTHGHVEDDDGVCELSPPASPSTVQAPIDTYLTSVQQETSPDGNSPHKIRRRGSERADLISKGLISAENAELLVQQYLFRLDRFLYGIASHYKDLHEVRRASPVLLAAMCAVSAFQDVEKEDIFDICNKEFRSLISASLFEKRDLEYIRALCIGSFWLPDASRILSSEAIRRAADCRLHRYFHRLTEPVSVETSPGQTARSIGDARDKVRLWYLLYVSDQHLSILHNRDSVMRSEKEAIEQREQFLMFETPRSAEDVRLISQVSLLVIMAQVRDVFGCEQNMPVSRTLGVQFTHFTRELDQWYGRFSPLFEPDPNIGAFPLAGLTMHYQFGKLYLGHHVFRGLKADPIPVHFLPAAIAARAAAVTIFTLILENEAMRSFLLGMPSYFHIMVLFGGHFLLEVCTKYREQLGIAVEEDFQRIGAVLALFARTPAMRQHPLSHVTIGLMRKLNECTAALGMDSVLTGSPFGNPEYAITRDFANPVGENQFSTFDVSGTGALPDDFLFADIGDLTFPDSQFQFLT